MSNTVKNTKRLIEYLEKRKDCRVTVYNEKNENWYFYYHLTGLLDGKYFDVTINHHVLTCEMVSIEKLTECKEEMTEILNQFELL